MKADMFFLLFCIFTGIHSNPGRPAIPHDSNAHSLFQAVEGNNTAVGYITEDRVHQLFFQFDLNGNYGYKSTTTRKFKRRQENQNSVDLPVLKMLETIYVNCGSNSWTSPRRDGRVSEQEFLKEWNTLHLGREDHASFLFQQVDTDRDGELSQNPDISRVYSFFDIDGDHRVSEDEFLIIWYSISGGDQ